MKKIKNLKSFFKKSLNLIHHRLYLWITGTFLSSNPLTDQEKNIISILVHKLLLFVLVPTSLAGMYFALFAPTYYESESKFIIQNNKEQSMVQGFIGGFTQGALQSDPYIIEQFIHSRDLLKILIENYNFLEKQGKHDSSWSKLIKSDKKFEELFIFYKKRINVSYDSTSSILTLRVQAPKATDAQYLAKVILEKSEKMVNHLSQRAYEDRVSFAQSELLKAESKLTESKKAFLAFQNNIHEVNPLEKVQSILKIRNHLEFQLAELKTDLIERQYTQSLDSFECQALERKISAVKEQIHLENEKLISAKSPSLNTAISKQESLLIAKEFSENLYQLALGELEKARVDAGSKNRYLVTISSPSLPDKLAEPKVVKSTLTFFIFSLILLVIGSLSLSALREHTLF